MNKLVLAALAAALCAGANAQVVLYNGLGNVPTDGYWAWDGGANDEGGTAYGGQVGQLLTDVAGGNTISSVEAYYFGFDATSTETGMLVQVFDVSGGVVGSMVGQETVAGSEVDFTEASGALAGFGIYDITADVSISGLVAGQQYLVTMQGQGGNTGYLAVTAGGSPDTYLRDFTSSGSNPIYNQSTWEETSAYGISAGNSEFVTVDTGMQIQATPEPLSMGVVSLGVAAMIRRRRRA